MRVQNIAAFLLIIAIFCGALTGCGKSEEVKSVEELIAKIGTVTIDSQDAIIRAERAFSLLSVEDQNKVENYNTLLLARNTYNSFPKETELTKSNIRQFLSIETSIDEKKKDREVLGFAFYSAQEHLKIYPIKPGSFSDVKITLEIDVPSGWEIHSSDPLKDKYNADDKTVRVDIILPADGNYSTSIKLSSMISMLLTTNPLCRVVSVTGTFVE